MSGRVHQVLATLGYGDAIGHEVLGIQRVLRGAGYESEIFVETADRRLEDLTTDYREMVGRDRARRRPHPSLLDRIARVADRLRAARADGARLPQHHAARVLPRRAQGSRQAVLPRPARADRLRLALRPRARRLRVQPPGARAARLRAPPACCRSSPTSRISTCRPTSMTAGPFDDGWTNIMFVGRVIPNKKFEDVIRAFHVYRTAAQSALAAAAGRLLRRLREIPAMLHALVARLGTPRRPFPRPRLERGADRALRRRRPLPVRQRARGLLRAAHRELLQAVPVLAYAATAVPATMDGGGVLYDTKDPFEVARVMAAILDDADLEDRGDRDRRTPRSTRLLAEGLRRHAAPLRRPSARHRSASGPEVPYDFWAHVRSGRAARGAAPVPAGGLSGPAERSVGSRSPIPDPRSPDENPPVGSGGAPRRRDRRQRADRCASCCARMGHESELFALTIDDDLRGDVLPFADREARAAATSRSFTSRCRRR